MKEEHLWLNSYVSQRTIRGPALIRVENCMIRVTSPSVEELTPDRPNTSAYEHVHGRKG